MKLPAKIFVIQESVRISPSKSPAIIGDWATTKTFAHDTEYIRRDVVIQAMKKIENDALDKACIKFNGFPKGLHESTVEEKNKILNKVIDKIELKGVAK